MIVFTGGGTGGHIYPALEIARTAREHGADLSYLGSFRGQESKLAEAAGIEFQGFPSEPLYSLRTRRGLTALMRLLKASALARAYLKLHPPEAVFSTGGYSAAPVMQAAKSLGLPLFIHEANSIPGRANRRFAPTCRAFTCVFRKTQEVIPNALRLGQPIRRELREAAAGIEGRERSMLLVTGGSQGAQFLNDAVPKALKLLPEPPKTLIAAGPGNSVRHDLPADVLTSVPYLDSVDMAKAYARAGLAIGRSGGTLAEYAAFRIPSILIPLPTSADDHQLYNAGEFESMGAAITVEQANAGPECLAEAIDGWLGDPARRQKAAAALAEWDRPSAAQDIWAKISEEIH